MNDVKKLAGQTLVYGLGTIVPRFLNYIVLTPFYTRVFKETAEYGIVTELYAWMVIAMILLTYGMETAYFRFANKEPDPKKVYSTSIITLFTTSLAFAVLVFIFIGPVSSFFNYHSHPEYIKMFALIVAIDAFSAIPFAYLRSKKKPFVFSFIKVLNVVVSLGLAYFFLKFAPLILKNGGTWVLKIYNPQFKVGYVFLSNLIGSAFTLLLLIPFILQIKPLFDKKLLKRMLVYSWPLLVGGLAGCLNDVLDKILLRRMLGNEGLSTVGIYGAGYKVAILMSLFIQMYRFAAEPFFFERAGRKDRKDTYVLTMKYFVIAMVILYLGINLYMDFVQVLIGRVYRDSLVIVPIVSMAYLMFGIFINQSIWYKIEDKTIIGVYLTILGAAVTIILNLLFIPKYGYMASAWATFASYFSMVIASFWIGQKHYPVNYDIKGMILYIGTAVIMVLIEKILHTDSILLNTLIATSLMLIFIFIANKRDKFISVYLGKSI
jgi:O-antigen/teichoic acid export membrane protein